MSTVTVRNLSDEVHRALRVRAAQRGRSTEAEIREILDAAVRPPTRVKLGTMLAAIASEAGRLSGAEADAFDRTRDESPAEPLKIE